MMGKIGFASVIGIILIVIFFNRKWQSYKNEHGTLVQDIFLFRKNEMEEVFASFFSFCKHYNTENESYHSWIESQEVLLSNLMVQLTCVSGYNSPPSLEAWFNAREGVLSHLRDFTFDLLAHPFLEKKVTTLFVLNNCIKNVCNQENYFELEYFDGKDIDWVIDVDKSITKDFCGETKKVFQKMLNSKSNAIDKA